MCARNAVLRDVIDGDKIAVMLCIVNQTAQSTIQRVQRDVVAQNACSLIQLIHGRNTTNVIIPGPSSKRGALSGAGSSINGIGERSCLRK